MIPTNYSMTKCSHCEKIGFELVEDTPVNSNWKYMYLRCQHCKTFLAILPWNNTNILIDNIQTDIFKIKKKLGIIDLGDPLV